VSLNEHAPRRRGFGTVVLDEMLAHNLKAQVSLTFAPSGLSYRMVLPLANQVLQSA